MLGKASFPRSIDTLLSALRLTAAPQAWRTVPMRLTPWYFAAVAPIAIAGFLGAFVGQCAVLAVTIGIFVGTLSLGRHLAPSEDGNGGAEATRAPGTTELG
jgi:hypothetical protein